MFHAVDSTGLECNVPNHNEPGILLEVVELGWTQTTLLHSVRESHQNGPLKNEQDDHQDHENDQ